jgi:hypothetical protein
METAMNAFHRLSQLSSTVKKRALPIWTSAERPLLRGLQWLGQWLKRRRRPVLVIITGGLLLYLGLPYGPRVWSAYKADRDSFTPFFTPIAALLVGLAAFGQWRTARLRHEEQTSADRRRRITETYSRAVTQLASDKLEERLCGIYTSESISKESPADYWTVMETLTAFVRERAPKPSVPVDAMAEVTKRAQPRTDIAAVLAIIARRDAKNRRLEVEGARRLNLSGTDLRALTSGGPISATPTPATPTSAGPTLGEPSSAGSTSLRLTSSGPISAGPISGEPSSAGSTSLRLTSSGPTSAGLISGSQGACRKHSSAEPPATPQQNFLKGWPGRRIGRSRRPTPGLTA